MLNRFRQFARTPLFLVLVCVAVLGLSSRAADAQTTGLDQAGLNDLQSLINQATGGTTTTGTTDTTDRFGTTQATGDTTTNGTIGAGSRTPIVSNNFTAHRAGGIQERRPGLQIQQAIAINQGRTNPFTNTEPVGEPGFFRVAFQEIIRSILGGISDGISGLNLASSLSSFSNLTNLTGLFGNLFQNPTQTPNQQTDITPIDNSTTTGQGTVTPII
ncbi:MAG: hypothetical protein HUU22_05680 [Phycisphaerae bacterium]|nr:hypothetical protein [Phycisphaerae bacterium]NUQ45503.1 hypothetical protein [Phycisphaerae bacterium]